MLGDITNNRPADAVLGHLEELSCTIDSPLPWRSRWR
jgi:hypothetical protein